MIDYKEPELSVLVLDFLKPEETKLCLESIRFYLRFPHCLIYLDNGGAQDYAWQYYKDGLCDILISKGVGRGGGFGQTDLFRFSSTPYSLFVQSDQIMGLPLELEPFHQLTKMLEIDFQCIDLNGDQSARGVWTDRAHLIKTDFFNSLGPFPNGGPGNDARPWNEAHLQKVFQERGYRIAHINPTLFKDNGKWSMRQAGDALYRHRCDTKQLWILKKPTYRTEVYPPFDSDEWERVLAGKWVDGDVPTQWKPHSFKCWS